MKTPTPPRIDLLQRLFTSFIVVLGFGFSLHLQAAGLACKDLLRSEKVAPFAGFNLRGETKGFVHSARFIGDQMTQEGLQRNILELSGRFPIDDKGCIGDRCTIANKDRYVAYLQNKLNRQGVQNFLEVGEPSYSSDHKEKPAVNRNPGAGPLDFSTAAPQFVKTLFKTKRTKLAGQLLQALGISFEDRTYEIIDSIFLTSLIDFLRPLDLKPSALESLPIDFDIAKLRRLEVIYDRNKKQNLVEQLEMIRDRVRSGDRAKNEARIAISESKVSTARRPHIINVIAEIKGSARPDEVIEVSAHYDTMSDGVPGADDNGSGLSTMLEMIRVFKKFPPERTLRFVFADLEERGQQGSRLHTRNLIQRGEKILGALIIDTIGYHPLRESGEKPVFVLELGTPKYRPQGAGYAEATAFSDIIAWQFARYERYVRMSVETEGAMPGTADHGSYIDAGLPGILVAAPYEGDFINPGYHNSRDVIEQYNWLYFTSIARTLTEAIAVASGAKVSRTEATKIDPETLAHYQNEYKNADPSANHRNHIAEKGGYKYRSSTSSSPRPSTPYSDDGWDFFD